ncbi:hypothetical protein ABAC402_15215 [Asticcacaulis sp. AC402]|nr:hypothetical protein ABAC402_15215 [Asticcacaulis sp. AC402]
MNIDAALTQPGIADLIPANLIVILMNFTIDLDAKPGLGTVKIKNKRPDRMLISKHRCIGSAIS